MSVTTTTSQSPPVTFESMSHVSGNYKQQYAIALEDIPPRSPSISSYTSNYSASTAPTVYSVASPTTPKSSSYRLGKQSGRIAELRIGRPEAYTQLALPEDAKESNIEKPKPAAKIGGRR